MTAVTRANPLSPLLARLGRDRAGIHAALAVALFAHAAIARALPCGALAVPGRAQPLLVVDLDVTPPPLEPPAPPPAPSEPTVNRAARVPRPSVNPAPARAAQVLTRAVDPHEPVDLTDSFVTGSASTYAGGATSALGTGDATAIAGGAPSGARTVVPAPSPALPPLPDRSRRPQIAGGAEWRCPFPPEADAAGIDSAVATIHVDVDASGAVRSASIQADPGHGFGREARRCALTRTWKPALDRNGEPTDGRTVVAVCFER